MTEEQPTQPRKGTEPPDPLDYDLGRPAQPDMTTGKGGPQTEPVADE